MFEGDWDDLDAAATLDAAVDFNAAENHAALGKLRAALHFADLHGHLPAASHQARTMPGGERLKVYGGDGCPEVAEFAPAEYAAVLGLTGRSGAAFIGEALALRHRFPRIWARTLAEHTLAWRARAVARRCLALSLEAAAWLDERIVGTMDGLSTFRFYELLEALVKQADPDAARRAAEERAKDRGVFVNPSDGEGTKTIYVMAATGDVIRFDATICDLAWALAMMGDTDTLDQRRAKAIGWIADPAAAYELLNAARYLATQQTRGTITSGAACHGTCSGTCTTDTDSDTDIDADTNTDADTGTGMDTDIDAEVVGESEGWFPADEPGMQTDREDADPAVPDLGDQWFPPDEPGSEDETEPDTCHPGMGEHPDPADGPGSEDKTEPDTHHPDATAGSGDEWFPGDEPDLEDEADRDTPHPSTSGHLDHLDALTTRDILKAIAGQAWRHPRPPNDANTGDGATPPPQPPPPEHHDSDTTAPQGTALPSTSHSLTSPGDVTGEPSDDARHTCAANARGSSGADSADAEAAAGDDAFSRRGLAGRLAAIKQATHTNGPGGIGTRGRPRTILYVHLTDQTLLSANGIMRVEEHGALLASQLRELLGHDQVVLKPVIDLKDKISVDAYEIPTGIRERVKLMHPTERFPFGTTETTMRTDLDHIKAYNPTGPPAQTGTDNLSPAGRFNHRLKTSGGWTVDQLDDGTLLWTSPNGFQFRVDYTGTHPITDDDTDIEED